MSITEQEYFMKTVDYLRRQPVACQSLSGKSCCFFGPEANRCAVGYWIPVEYETKILECKGNTSGMNWLLGQYPELSGIAWVDSRMGVEMALELQSVHDCPSFRDENGGGLSEGGEAYVRKIARRFKVEYTAPEERIYR